MHMAVSKGVDVQGELFQESVCDALLNLSFLGMAEAHLYSCSKESRVVDFGNYSTSL